MKESKLNKIIRDVKLKLSKPPKIRAGVYPTRVMKDKSKYTRKDKHKKNLKREGE